MRGLRPAFFWRLHLRALAADWRRTLLSVVGVGIGVTVVLGVLVLKAEVLRPFDSYGPALVHAADHRVIQVTPRVGSRLPATLVDRLGAEVPAAEAVIPVVAELTPVSARGADHGFLLLGGSCDVEKLIGPFGCRPPPGPLPPAAAVPLHMAATAADQLGLRAGSELVIPGLAGPAATVASTFPDDRVRDINNGFVLLAPSVESAARLVGTPGFVSSVFVLAEPDADVDADINRVIGDLAVAGPPRPAAPVALTSTAQSFNLTALAGVLIGFLIAVNTVLLAIENRRPVLGTILAIGARPGGVLGALLAEGALVGAAGGLLAVLPGYLLGAHLVRGFGQSVLAGSGATISAHFSSMLIVIALAAGATCGMLAMAGPAVRLVRSGSLAALSNTAGPRRLRAVSWQAGAGGLALIVASLMVLVVFGRGLLPADAGSNAMMVGLLGVALVTMWSAPRLAGLLVGVLRRARPAIGRLLTADLRRYSVMFSLSAAVLALGSGLAIGSHTMQTLGTAAVAAQKAQLIPDSLLLSAQSVLDQSSGHIDDNTVSRVQTAAAGAPVAQRWRATITDAGRTRLVIGVTPGDRLSSALYRPVGDAGAMWTGIRSGGVGLSTITAARLTVAVGDPVTVPTVSGLRTFRVAGLFEPQMISNSAVGDIVVVSAEAARAHWGAVRDLVAVSYPSADAASAHRAQVVAAAPALTVYDDAAWRTGAARGITRFFEPFTAAGYAVMAAAGLSVLNVFVLGLVARKRERSVLRAVGVARGHEQAVVIGGAVLLCVIVVVMGGLGAMLLTGLQSLGSPVNYGVTIDWGVSSMSMVTGIGALAVLIAAATVVPLLHTRRLRVAEELRSPA